MPNCKYLDGTDFKKTGFSYNNLVAPQCKIQPYRGKFRISFLLPTGQREYYYKILTDSTKNEVSQKRTLHEFESLIRSGYFPLKSVPKLKEFKTPNNKNKMSLTEGMEKYYTIYNNKRNFKREITINNQKGQLKTLLALFQKKTGKQYLEDVTTIDLASVEDNLDDWCAEEGKPIGVVTTSSYKRILKSFFNCLARKRHLDMNPAVIASAVITSGHQNIQVGARTVIIPEVLLDAVSKCSYVIPRYYPDRKGIVNLYRETGIARAEMATLSEYNLYPSVDNFDSIQLKDKPSCPTNSGIGFQVKSHNRHIRIIPLEPREIKFIKYQLQKHKNDKILGRTKIKGNVASREYRFLFPIFHHGMWQRCDTFLNGIQNLFEFASTEMGIGLRGKDYTVSDFRNTLNERMGDAGMSAEDRAYILGHSKDVNENNYMNQSKKKELAAIKSHKAFKNMRGKKRGGENHKNRVSPLRLRAR